MYSILKSKKHKIFLLSFLLLLLFTGCSSTVDSGSNREPAANADILKEETVPAAASGEMKVHFLDVGQGLSVFVQSDGQNLIYDGGDRETSRFVVAYLKQQGVTEIDYLVSSHYDADHLAGLIGCLNAFTVHNVIGSDYEHTTKLYNSFIDSTAEQGLEIQHPSVGAQFQFGSGKFTVLSPASIVNDSNANSVVIKLENGDNSFLLTGDADHKAEAVMCSSGLDLESDVLSVAHHGSATATSYDFLEQVVPEFAVVSCGQNNQYDHPDADTMDKLESMDISVYRSDLQGTVTALSDGQKITWDQEPCNDYSPGSDSDLGTQIQKPEQSIPSEIPEVQSTDEDSSSGNLVWKSATGKKYHRIPNCGTMNPDKADQMPLNEAELSGLEPCGKCF